MYKIEITEGCLSFEYLINGITFDNCTEATFREVLHSLIQQLDAKEIVNEIIDCIDVIHYGHDLSNYRFEVRDLWEYVCYMINNYDDPVDEYSDKVHEMDAIIDNLNDDEVTELRNYLLKFIEKEVLKDPGWIQQMLRDLVSTNPHSKYENFGVCNSCGDVVDKYTLVIE